MRRGPRIEPPLTGGLSGGPTGPRRLPARRRLRRFRALRLLPLMATLAAATWALSSNPLATPMVERSANALALTLELRVRRAASADWIAAELDAAVAAGDAERAAMLLDLAADLGRDVATGPAEALLAARAGWGAATMDCLACMADVATCPTLAKVAACAVPFEMSPLGDANALRRAGMAYATGGEVDEIDAGLAIVGLAATGAVLVSGGASGTAKAGAGLLRLARRMGSVTPALARELALPIRWGAVAGWLGGTRTLAEVTDVARLTRVAAIGADMDRVRRATSTADALRLARLVDGPQDAARLARVAEAAGPRTGRTLAVLGKGRALRATVRLSRAAAGTLALLWLAALQLGVTLATWAGGRVFRAGLDMVDRPGRHGQS